MPVKLNLGCGTKLLDGYVNCDNSDNVNVDKKFDLNTFPYPFEDNSVDEILLDNVLEHLDNIVAVMEELYRILKNAGKVNIFVPYAKSDWAFQDPTHIHFFTENSMNYFSTDSEYNYYTKVRYKIIRRDLVAESRTSKNRIRNLIPFRSVLRYFLWNMYDAVYFVLEACKQEDILNAS